MPDFHIDNHVTDGSDMQYDVTWDMARNQDIAEPAGAWVRDKFVPELDKRMAADGHLVAPYGALRNVGGQARILHGSLSRRAIRISMPRCRIARRCWWRRTA